MSKYKDRVEQGLCGTCGLKNESSSNVCLSCRIKQNASHSKRRKAKRIVNLKAGLCYEVECSKPVTKGIYCEECKIRRRAGLIRAHYVSRYGVKWSLLKALYDRQLGRCALSGVPIVLGDTAELDHVLATANGGVDSIDNYQWVHRVINRMKGALHLDEFEDWCCAVEAHKNSSNTTSV